MGKQVTVSGLTKRFGEVIALNRLSLTVESNEFLVLLGPSGCGKTTLLRSIAGLETPDEGVIILGDRIAFSSAKGLRMPAGKRELGMVFQSYALWPHMTVFENIAFGLRLMKSMSRKDIQDRVERVLEDLSLSKLGKRFPSELSGGQQQRVAVARLLAARPSVFLMDEPLSNLDARLRLDMRSELLRLHHEADATAIYVTHDQTEALTLASRLVVMKEGEIQQVAPPREVYLRPANLFVADFIGMPSMNLLPTRSLQIDGGTMLDFGDFQLPMNRDVPIGEFILGVRPEDVHASLQPKPNAAEFKVYSVQQSGPELFIHVICGNTRIVVREARHLDLELDQPIWIEFDVPALNLYHAESRQLWKENDIGS